MVNFHKPFDEESIPQLLMAALVRGEDFETAQAAIDTGAQRGFRTPSAAWLHRILRPVFDEQFPDDEEYDTAFDTTEVILGLVDEDLRNLRFESEERKWLRGTNWLGRATWRSRYRHESPLEEFSDQLAKQYSSYAPLEAGLFGGSYERAKAATEHYRESFDQLRNRFL